MAQQLSDGEHWILGQELHSWKPTKVDPLRASQAMIAVHSLATLPSFFPFLCLWLFFAWAGVGVTFSWATACVWETAPTDLEANLLLPIVLASIEPVDCWTVACKGQSRDLHMFSIAVHIERNVDVVLSKDVCTVDISMVRELLRSFLQKSEPKT